MLIFKPLSFSFEPSTAAMMMMITLPVLRLVMNDHADHHFAYDDSSDGNDSDEGDDCAVGDDDSDYPDLRESDAHHTDDTDDDPEHPDDATVAIMMMILVSTTNAWSG